jgi:hypothetical protein
MLKEGNNKCRPWLGKAASMPEESLRAELVEQDETRWLLAPELQG